MPEQLFSGLYFYGLHEHLAAPFIYSNLIDAAISGTLQSAD